MYINYFTYLYIARKNIDMDKVILQETEVSEIRFVNKQEYLNLLNKGEMVEVMKHCYKLFENIK